MKLSILIPTLTSRAEMFARLVKDLEQQISLTIGNQAEIVWLADKGELTIGSKRQRLLELAKGDYVVFIDDDDFIHPKYVQSILDAIDYTPDVVTFKLQYTTDMRSFKHCYFGLYKKDADFEDRFERLPNHLCPVKKSLALKVGFNDMTYREDTDFAARLRPHLNRRYHIDLPLYTYWDRKK